MLGRPQLGAHLRSYVESPERAYVLGEEGTLALRGRLYPRLLPLLDGRRSLPEIVAELQEDASLVWLALERLAARGLLCEGDTRLAAGTAAFASSLGVDPGRAADRCAARAVCVLSLGGGAVEPLLERLHSSGLRTVDDETAAALNVVLADHYLRPELTALNQRALEKKQPWLLLRPGGISPWLGPLFLPGVTGCHACLTHRLRLNRRVEAVLREDANPDRPLPAPASGLPALQEAALALATTEIARWVLLAPSTWSTWPERLSARLGPLGHIVVLASDTLDLQRHPLTRRPQCPSCGRSEPSPLGPVKLESRPKGFTDDGGHRSLRPDQTIEHLTRHISPITGLVPAIDRRGPADAPIHAYTTWPHALVGRGDDGSLKALHTNASGKGKGDRQAFASALCESLEHYSAYFTGSETRIRARHRDLEGAVHPAQLLHFSDLQYRDRARWNREHFEGAFQVPEPYDEDAAIDWTPVWALGSNNVRYLPTAYCYFDYPFGEAPRFCAANSNGNAAGNNREEAILQGFFELVERDSVALWWFNRLRRPGVDLAGFGEPYLVELSEYHRSKRRELWAIDLTADLGIPAFVAMLRRLDGPSERIVMGSGAHFDARLALLRAATEANQMAIGRGTLDDVASETGRPDTDEWLRTATVGAHPYLLPDPALPPKTAGDYPDLCHKDLRDDIYACVQIAARQGLEVLVLDQTRPDVGLAVVKVVVPDLRHFWPRFGPGRLYDVPVKLGWVKAPLDESELNPTVTVL